MDLAILLHRHQVSLARAASAAGPEARYAHNALASGYSARIAMLRAAPDPAILLPVLGV